jgi:MFS family permease
MSSSKGEACAPGGISLPSSTTVRVSLVVFAMFQITLAAGLIVGWAGIAGSMLAAPQSHGGAGVSLDDATQLFGLAASINYIAPLFLGIVLDHRGPRSCSVLSNTLVATGCAVFAAAGDLRTYSMGIGLVAFGGPGVQTSLMHVGNLFPQRRFFVMGVVAETITLSFAVFPLMDILWETTGWTFRGLFGCLGLVVAMSALGSFLVWPDSPYEIQETVVLGLDRNPEGTIDKIEDAIEETLLTPADKDGKHSMNCLLDLPIQGQLTSGVFIRLSIFFLVTSFWANFYIATVTTELGDQQLFDFDTQHQLARLLSFIDAGAIVCAPVSGFLLDSAGFIPTAFITITLGIVQMALLMIAGSNENIMIASFVSYAIFRAFLFPYFFASLSKKLGFRFFGVLSGISFSISGVSQLSIAPLANRVKGTCHEYEDAFFSNCSQGQWMQIHAIQCICLLVLLLIPLLDRRANQQETLRKRRRTLESSTSTSYGSTGEVN